MNMKRYAVVSAVLLGLSAGSCTQEKNSTAGGDSTATCAPLNPNGDSELAIMMRNMALLSEANAAALREGKELVAYDGSFSGMFQAERSMKIDDVLFEGMGKSYLATLEQLYKAPVEERVALHNNLIQTCQACHEQSCRGPLKRIDKMLVKL